MGFVNDFLKGITGETAAEASIEAAGVQGEAIDEAIAAEQQAAELGLGFLEPFAGAGTEALGMTSFLTDPQQQFDFLQNNPLFQMSLENLNRETKNMGSARGRLSAGDTLQQLSQNALLAAQPLIQGQKQSIGDLLNLGTGVARAQANTAIGQGSNIANLITSGGAAEAAGIVGAGNAMTSGAQNALQTGLLAYALGR
jgi:hypothetical protein